MPYRIEFVDAAIVDLRALRTTDQVKVLDRIEDHLTHEPLLQSRSRIKRLRPGTFPPFRLRVDEFRVYYDVDPPQRRVVVYGVVPKTRSAAWLERSVKDYRKRGKS